jgi:mono/diheme cytochrome c family protein
MMGKHAWAGGIAIFAFSICGVAGIAWATASPARCRGDHEHLARIGLQMAPVPLRTRGKNLESIGVGSYLVNAVAGCSDCHTHPAYLPGGDPFRGESEVVNTDQYLAGGRQFGPFTSANLTPDTYGRPAGLTFEEFCATLRTGRLAKEGGRLLQVMPWPAYGKMTTEDLRAIYDYLSAIPSLPDNPKPGS